MFSAGGSTKEGKATSKEEEMGFLQGLWGQGPVQKADLNWVQTSQNEVRG